MPDTQPPSIYDITAASLLDGEWRERFSFAASHTRTLERLNAALSQELGEFLEGRLAHPVLSARLTSLQARIIEIERHAEAYERARSARLSSSQAPSIESSYSHYGRRP